MKLPLYQIDAFTSKVFRGNPAAVVPLEAWLSDDVLQNIATENNLSETAFFVRQGDDNYDLRWFTPTIEIPLCGHATLASAFVLFIFQSTQSRSLEVFLHSCDYHLLFSIGKLLRLIALEIL